VPTVSLSQLYSFASRLELCMVLVAFVFAAAAGACNPLMLLAFRDMFSASAPLKHSRARASRRRR
jgi:hypothetical protein